MNHAAETSIAVRVMQHKAARVFACLALVGAAVAVVVGADRPGSAVAAPPATGIFIPGVSLGGVELGMTKREVLSVWGRRHGVCRNCGRTTWYFNEAPFEREGAGVAFRRGRVVHVFTLWQPAGWKTVDGLVLGADESQIAAGSVIVDERACVGYTARLASTGRSQTVFYVYDDRLWAFGLIRPGADPCP